MLSIRAKLKPRKESKEHKALKELVKSKFSEWFGPSIVEYPSSGHELDVFTVTFSGIEILVEIIWTPSKTHFWRDISLIQTSDAKIKVVIAHPKIAKSMAREFKKVVIGEAKRGSFVVAHIVDGQRLLKDNEYVDCLKADVENLLTKTPLMAKIAYLKSIMFREEPISQLISESLEIAREMKRKEDVKWLERELYGFPEIIGRSIDRCKYFENIPGRPTYRLIEGEVNLYFEGIGVMQRRFPFAVGFPASEIERWIDFSRGAKEILINMDPPRPILQLFEEHKLVIKSERMPVVFQVVDLKRILANLRQRLYKFLTEIEDSLKKA